MNKTKKLLTIGACTLLLSGCGSIPTLSDGSQAVVNFKEESLSISANELYEKMKESYALDTMITIMDTKVLEKEYPDNLKDAKETAETTVESMVDTYGEDYITSYFGSVDAYQNFVYLNNLRQKAIVDYAKSLVSEKELKSYYDKNIYGDVTVSHILIQTGVTDNTSAEDKTKLEKEAKDKINAIIKKLDEADDKKAKFAELAKTESDDDATKENGGSLGAINTGTLSSAYDEILESARKLKDGEYSKTVITTELGYHVIYRESSKEKAKYEDKVEEMKEAIANDKLSDDATIQVTAMDELRKKYEMDIMDDDIKEKYATYIANQIAAARNSQTN